MTPLRFALYARTSTEDQQSPTESLAWQRARAEGLVAGHGEIVEVFHDVGQSRSLPWPRREKATALLAEVASPVKCFDAIVIAEPARAFYGGQYGLVYPVLVHYGVDLWVPEVGGRVDPDSEGHDNLMALYGGQSKGERNRIKIRVKASMTAQAAQGRWLGGRPPHGYQLVDAGPHPNPAKARDGLTLKRLDIDPVAAPVVRRIFADYLAGKGPRTISEELTAEGVPSPSGHDPERNRHRARSQGAWSRSAVRAILMNPVYTGRRAWGRARWDESQLYDVANPALGQRRRQVWTDPSEWVWSPEETHPPIISAEEFAQAERIRLGGTRRPTGARRAATKRTYALRGMVWCSTCQRRHESTSVKGRAYYRCRLSGSDYARSPGLEATHPKTSYLPEAVLTAAVDRFLGRRFDPDHVEETINAMAAAAEDPQRNRQVADARRRLVEVDKRLDGYRRALDAGADPAVVAEWTRSAQADRAAAEEILARTTPVAVPTVDELRQLLAELGDVVVALAEVTPEDRTRIYESMGLRIEHQPGATEVVITVTPPASAGVGVGGGT